MSYSTHDDYIIDAVNTYSDMVIRLAFQHTRNRADSEDILQDVFLSLIKQPPIGGGEHLKAWLIRVTINKCKNFLKSAKKRKDIPLDSVNCFLENQSRESIGIYEEIFKLPEFDRNIIYLFYIEGYSAKEIADIIGKKENAVFTALNRARQKLRNILEDK